MPKERVRRLGRREGPKFFWTDDLAPTDFITRILIDNVVQVPEMCVARQKLGVYMVTRTTAGGSSVTRVKYNTVMGGKSGFAVANAISMTARHNLFRDRPNKMSYYAGTRHSEGSISRVWSMIVRRPFDVANTHANTTISNMRSAFPGPIIQIGPLRPAFFPMTLTIASKLDWETVKKILTDDIPKESSVKRVPKHMNVTCWAAFSRLATEILVTVEKGTVPVQFKKPETTTIIATLHRTGASEFMQVVCNAYKKAAIRLVPVPAKLAPLFVADTIERICYIVNKYPAAQRLERLAQSQRKICRLSCTPNLPVISTLPKSDRAVIVARGLKQCY